jgi:hypothetical protein
MLLFGAKIKCGAVNSELKKQFCFLRFHAYINEPSLRIDETLAMMI